MATSILHSTVNPVNRYFKSAAAAVAIVALAAAAPGAVSAQPFEGVITVSITGSGAQAGVPTEALYYASRTGKARIEMTTPMGKAAIIIAPADQKMFMLVDALSQYFEQDIGQQLESTKEDLPAAKVERTGRKETIAGHECEVYIIDGMDVCAARGLGSYLNIGGPIMSRGNVPAWQSKLMSDGVFPLRVRDPGGNTQLLVTKIERKSVDPGLFRVPDNFTRLSIPGT